MQKLMPRTPGWLARYLHFRHDHPFPSARPVFYPPPPPPTEEELELEAYEQLHRTGMLLGCPVVSEELWARCEALAFPYPQGGPLLLFLETLFGLTLAEEERTQLTRPEPGEQVKQVTLRLLRFFLPQSYYRFPEELSLPELLATSEVFQESLFRLEKVLLNRVAVAGYSSDPRQNAFVFLNLHTFLRWSRALRQDPEAPLAPILEEDLRFRKGLLQALIAVIWADHVISDTERQVVNNYLGQSGLPAADLEELQRSLREPYRLEHVTFHFHSPILRRYLVEQMILLSLIDNNEAWEERSLIAAVAEKVGMTPAERELLYASVARFFEQHGHRFAFLHNNPAVRQMQEYVEENIIKLIKLNLNRIIQEVQETKELYDLLMKATVTPLTEEEWKRVSEQIQDVLKAVPALALFALPGGTVLLPIVIRLLPFNILPSSFQNAPSSR